MRYFRQYVHLFILSGFWLASYGAVPALCSQISLVEDKATTYDLPERANSDSSDNSTVLAEEGIEQSPSDGTGDSSSRKGTPAPLPASTPENQVLIAEDLLVHSGKNPVKLPLINAIRATLQNNVDITVQEFQSNIRRENIVTEEATFDPNIVLEGRANEEEIPVASAFASPDVSNTEQQSWKAGLTQKLITGTEYELNYTGRRNETNSRFAGLSPQYTSRVELNITQPLLKNFGIGTNKKDIFIAQNNLQISDNEFKSRVIEIITQTELTYWDLVFNREDLRVKKESVKRAQDLERRVRAQVKVGTLAPIEILQAQSEVASREEAVLLAQKAIRDTEDQLKNIMNIPFDSPEGKQELLPMEAPVFNLEPQIKLEDSIREALDNRPDYHSLKKELENNNIQVKFNENQLYPSLDLVGTFGLNGLSGAAVPITSGAVVGTSRFGGPLSQSTEDVITGDYKNWEVGLLFNYPIGNRAAKSRLSASRLEAAQSLLDLKNLEKSIIVEVREAARQILTDIKRVHAARISRQLAEEKLRAEEKKFAVGLSTSFEVLEFQTDLASEESKELKAITDYKKSLNNFRKVKATTLKTYQVHLDDRSMKK